MLQAVEAVVPVKNDQLILTLEGLRNSLAKISKDEIDQLPGSRVLKVHYFSRTNGRKPTVTCPEIVLRGNWLQKTGFTYDDQYVHVIPMNGMIVIIPE